MKLIVDRFEENFAVCIDENNHVVNICINKLPDNAKEGSTILKKNDKYYIDQEDTDNRKERIEKLMDDLWK